MMEHLNNPYLQAGFVLGAAFFGVMWFVVGLINSSIGYSDKWKKKHRDSLTGKLRAAGYTAYTPLVMGSQLKLKTPLSHGENVVLSLDGLIVFDPEGNTVTGLLPLTTESEQTAEYRRGQFKVIPGGKTD